jgi:type II secretory pathway predicted ATPase ExeA
MFSEFFKLKVNPFGETPNTRFFFKSNSHVAALDKVITALREGKGFTLITGEVGVGKTMLSRLLLGYLQKRTPTALILNPVLCQQDLLTSIREELKLPAPETITIKSEYDQLVKFLIETAAAKKRTVLFIDEAQRLSFEGLEAVRLLSNLETEDRKLLQIILIGQPELNTRLEQHELRQLNQRISVRTELQPLKADEVESYIKHRIEAAGGANFIRFDAGACQLIAKSSKGIPRLINSICEQVLTKAKTERVRLIDASFVTPLLPKEKRKNWKGMIPPLLRGAQP